MKRSVLRAPILLRKIHRWGSLLIMLPVGIMIGAGLLLMLKKELTWIQPPTQTGVERTAVPTASFEHMFQAARSVPQANIETWMDLARVDLKPGKGIAKFISQNNWEIQIDTYSAKVIQVRYRRSDIIEQIHDGSFFADWAKHYVFFPAGIVLFVLWGTGIYLFFLPHITRWRKKRRRQAALKLRPIEYRNRS